MINGSQRFITKAKSIYGDKYDYSRINYVNAHTKVLIRCNMCGNEFWQYPYSHLQGHGCPFCNHRSYTYTTEEYIRKANEVHHGKYSYDKTVYKNNRTKIIITCPVHGDFYQNPKSHLQGCGCPKCGFQKTADKKEMTRDDFLKKARKIHGDKYDYSKVDYKGMHEKVCIICPDHGEFWQTPNNHINNAAGCPKCGHTISKQEDEIIDFLKTLGIDNIEYSNKSILSNGQEIDIYLPDYKIGIEFDGILWHSEKYGKDKNYHINKTNECRNKDIRLIHIFDDEWNNKKDIWKSMLKNLFHKTDNTIYARKCTLGVVDAKTAIKFLNDNHLQGSCQSSVKLGLYYKDELVSLMTFGKSRHFVGNGKYQWELLRFASKINTDVIGAASKLLKYFIKTYNPENIVTFADRRWSNGNLYFKLGFNLYNVSEPNYFYLKDRKRWNRFSFRKSELIRKYNCPNNISEHEFCLSQGWYRVYDCGCLCFNWKNKDVKETDK